MSDRQWLRRVAPEDVAREARPIVSDEVLSRTREIVDDVRTNGEAAVRRYAERFGERSAEDALILGREAMCAAFDMLGEGECQSLERAAVRIRRFAQAQRAAINDAEIDIPGGAAGHRVVPVRVAGCYAPAGRYPLPSSVLMTAITARVAGCERVVVASPGAHPVSLAAAWIAGADAFLAVGGAHAVAAMSYGVEGLERCDVIAGPGNAWVTAAKKIVSGDVGIDMLAGPSELLILADETADAALVAADLLAQAEHDTDASAILVTTSAALLEQVEAELETQLSELTTRETAEQALANGFSVVASSIETAVEIVDRVAPEHLEIMTEGAEAVAHRVRNAGALFIGSASAEVFGDYGAGPNHTLPTGGTARFQAGLSVIHFLRLRTWLRIDEPTAALDLMSDTAAIAAMEGLDGHRRAALRRGR